MKLVIYPVIFLMVVGLAFAADMSRSMPDKIQPGETLTVTFSVSGMEAGQEVALSEILPSGWSIKSWDVTGSQEAKTAITYKQKTGNEHQWSFTASTANPSISYTAVVPSNAAGNYEFDAVYMLPPANMNNLKKTLVVRTITCGDGVCEGSENSDNCEADCPKPAEPVTTPPQEQQQQQQQVIIEEEAGGFPWWIVILLLVIIVVAYLYKRKKR
jgi:hypothetical protein